MKQIENGKCRVYKEYGMTPQSIAEDVQSIKNWLFKQPHLPHIQQDLLSVQVDEWLENYLISCKNSVERAKENLDMYFTSKILVPEVFTLRDPLSSSFRTSFDVMALGIMKEITEEGRRVIYFKHLVDNADDFEPVIMMKRLNMILEIVLLEGIDFIGLEVLVDYRNVCFSQLLRYNLTLTKKVFDIGLKALPQRVHRIHIVNPTPLVETALVLFKPVAQAKFLDRVVVHKDQSELCKLLGENCVPSDLGGQAESTEDNSKHWEDKLIQYRDWFQCNDTVKSDESKRIGKCRYESNDYVFGNQGSFRKIEVD